MTQQSLNLNGRERQTQKSRQKENEEGTVGQWILALKSMSTRRRACGRLCREGQEKEMMFYLLIVSSFTST